MDEEERDTLAVAAKPMAPMCVRNTKLEDIHAGIVPVSRTGDYSDVVVVDADGRHIAWPRVSHFDDDAMRDPMRQAVDRLYTFHVKIDDPRSQAMLEFWRPSTRNRDEPKLDEDLTVPIGARRDADGGEGRSPPLEGRSRGRSRWDGGRLPRKSQGEAALAVGLVRDTLYTAERAAAPGICPSGRDLRIAGIAVITA